MVRLVLFALVLAFPAARCFAESKVELESPDYEVLRKKCDSGCCTASVDTMQAHGGILVPESGKCPDGYSMEMLRCRQSYQWCERREEKPEGQGRQERDKKG